MEQYNQRTAAPDARGSSAQGAGSKCVKCATNPIVLKLINVINGALILLVGVLYWLSIPQNPTRSIQAALIGTYSIACGIIFLVFSIGFGKIDTCNRKNCGFVYTFYGRFLFVIFAGSLCFGLPDSQQTSADAKAAGGMLSSSVLGMVAGLLSWANALFNLWVICMLPEYSENIGANAGPETNAAGTSGPGSFQPPSGKDVGVPPDAFGSNSNWGASDNSQKFGGGNSGDDNPFA